MRAWTIVAFFLAGCGTVSTAPPAPHAVAPAAMEIAAEASPSNAELWGRWRFTHDGSDWVTLALSSGPSGPAAHAEAWHGDSWTQFEVTRIKIENGGRSLRIEARYLEFPTTMVAITLALDDDGVLIGRVSGETYANPSAVRGVRAD